MLAPILLSTLVAAVLATAGLFVPTPRRERRPVPRPRRTPAVVAGTLVLATAGAAVVLLAGYAWSTAAVVSVAFVVASVVWLPVTRRWSAAAHLAWASDVALFVAYLAFVGAWILGSPLGTAGRIGAFVLLALEGFAALLACAHLWDLCDEVGREHEVHDRESGLTPEQAAGAQQPFVSLHVATQDEDPDTLIACLESLCEIYYSAFEVVVVDHNTADEALWRPVEEWCAANGVKFAHLQDCPGYTSGALNHALREMTDPRAEVVGVIDPDYQVEPDFLLCCAPMLNDPAIGFVQSAQEYRHWRDVPFFRRLYHAHEHFFPIAQPSRNEQDGATFAGTMGLVRRAALDELGGWNERSATPDTELSLRLLRSGWSGRQVDTSFGHGLMPLSFEALKAERFRRCFGGIQALRMHGVSMLPRAGGRDNRLTPTRRWGLLSGVARWYGGLLGLVFYFFLLAGALDIAFGGGPLFRLLAPFLLAAVPVLGVVGLARAVTVMRRGTGASWSDVVGALFVSQATSLVVARASVRALFARRAEFLGTPRTAVEDSVLDAVRCNKAETTLAALGVVGIVASLMRAHAAGGVLLAALLLIPTLGYASAVVNSLSARRAALPADLQARRRAELRRHHSLRPRVAGLAAIGAAAATSAVVVGLIGPAGQDVSVPDLRSRQELTHDAPSEHGRSSSSGGPAAPGPVVSPVR
jgi:hypothetical protein